MVFDRASQEHAVAATDCAGIAADGQSLQELRVELDPGVDTRRQIGAATLRVEAIDANAHELRWRSDVGIDAVIIEADGGSQLVRFDRESFTDTHTFDTRVEPRALTFCYDFELAVNMDANASLTRVHEWNIEETADPTHPTPTPDSQATFTYRIKVTKKVVDERDWRAHGRITIDNLSPVEAVVEKVELSAADSLSSRVDCGVGLGDYTLDAGASLACSYEVEFPDGAPRELEARVETRGVVEGARSSAGVDFAGATIISEDDSIEVADSRGRLWTFEESGSSLYRRAFDCDEDAGMQSTAARIVGTERRDTTTVVVDCYPKGDDPTASHR